MRVPARRALPGLYQFIEQSWLRVMKQHGTEHGLGWAADSISTTSSGRMTVTDPGMRRAILALRNDPQTASIMAAEHASDNKDAIESSLGRDATGTDLYMAHFLGLGGARSFLGAMQDNPNRSGAAMFPPPRAPTATSSTPRTASRARCRKSMSASPPSSMPGRRAARRRGPASAGPSSSPRPRLGDSGATVIPGNGDEQHQRGRRLGAGHARPDQWRISPRADCQPDAADAQYGAAGVYDARDAGGLRPWPLLSSAAASGRWSVPPPCRSRSCCWSC